jgi:chemotaxis protein CheD
MKVSRAADATHIPALPHVLREFRHILHHWNPTRQSHVAHILPGQFYVSKEPILITTIVGSCVTVCIFDKKRKIGGMNHFMLPINNDPEKNNIPTRHQEAARYGNIAMHSLLHSIIKHGGKKENLELKVFGGGKILNTMPDIGLQNINFILEYIQTDGLNLVNQDVGGMLPRRIIFSPLSGRAQVRKLRGHHDQRIATREERYLQNIQHPSHHNMHIVRNINEQD